MIFIMVWLVMNIVSVFMIGVWCIAAAEQPYWKRMGQKKLASTISALIVMACIVGPFVFIFIKLDGTFREHKK